MDNRTICKCYAEPLKAWQEYFELCLYDCDTYGMNNADKHICEKIRDFCAEVGVTVSAWEVTQTLYAITGGEDCATVLAKLAC